jgi:hypothetical protein
VSGVTYDTGALIASDRDERRIWALHRRTLERGQSPTVPAGVLGQAWRGASQPQLSRLLAGCQVEELSEERARSAGALLVAAGRSDLIDATVVVGALAREDAIFSSDRAYIEALLAPSRKRLQIVDV